MDLPLRSTEADVACYGGLEHQKNVRTCRKSCLTGCSLFVLRELSYVESREVGWQLWRWEPVRLFRGPGPEPFLWTPAQVENQTIWGPLEQQQLLAQKTRNLSIKRVRRLSVQLKKIEQLWFSDFMDVLRRHFSFVGRGFSWARGPAGTAAK